MDLNDPTTIALLASDAFGAAGYAHAIYGGLLTAAYGEPRETRDADLAVVDLNAREAARAIEARGVQTRVAFEHVLFGGLTVSRVTVLGRKPDIGLNTVDLVRPRSPRYAALAVQRAVAASLRGRSVRVLTVEDFILFKLLSTRDRDLEDARSALRRSRRALEMTLLEEEIARVADELTDVDIVGRWGAIRLSKEGRADEDRERA